MNEVLSKLSLIGIVPVIKLDNAKDAAPLAAALCKGGLPCAEVTFRTDAAEESIRIISNQFPEMLVGAGTVLTTEQVDRAIAAGAKFIVSPGFNPKIVSYCISKNIPITPGCSTPSDIERAIELGLEVVKFFPAEAAGGLPMIKAMSAPYTNVKFMPTGGINAGNINDYLAFKKVIACGGSWMVTPALISAGKFDEIERLTSEAVATMLGFELAHVGINHENSDEAKQTADIFSNMFNLNQRQIDGAVFSGSFIESLDKPYLGRYGHIGFRTNNIKRAKFHLELKGYSFNEESAVYDEKGNLFLIYLKDEIAGFAIHLSQNKKYI